MRWQTTDPLGFEDGLNLYAYVHNNPFCYKDPDGKFAIPYPVIVPLVEVAFGTFFTATVLPALGVIAATTAIGWGCYQLAVYASNHIDTTEEEEFETKEEISQPEKKKKPRYCGKELGNDPTKCPGEGFQWKGNGEPGTGKGSWVKGERGEMEKLHPDLTHLPPVKPHWDFESHDFPDGVRLNIDGTWEHK